jgi:MSHA biogenesis protein MshP
MRPERGFSLITAIFLLVVLAALGSFALTFSSVQQAGAALDVQGSRAYQAARSGIEWGLYQVSAASACPAATHLAVPAGAGMATLTVTVNCAILGSGSEGGATVTVYGITATACNQPTAGGCPGTAGGLGYVERQLQAKVSR